MISPKILIVAGEPSGDLHAGNLARELRSIAPDVELFGYGGATMREAGVEILEDPTRLAVIGLVEVLKNLSAFRRLFRSACEILDRRRPDLVVLVDYPGFNLRFAREVKRRGIRLLYYISPQIWAWDPGRIRSIRRLVDRMLVVFPFEKDLYEKNGVPVTFVGHPLLDLVKPSQPRMETLQRIGLEDGLPVIGLLPGSREGEVRRLLPVLLAAAERMRAELPSSACFLLIKAPHLPWEIYRGALDRSPVHPKVVERWDYDCLHACDLVAVASGTATLECALLERPMVIVYKTSWPTYLLSRLLIRIPAIGLVNVVAAASGSGTRRPGALAGRKIVLELIQHRASPRAIAEEMVTLWRSAERREKLKEDLEGLRSSLGSPGAGQRAARIVLEELKQTPPTAPPSAEA